MFITGLFLACSGRPAEVAMAPEPLQATPATFAPRTFTLPDGTEIAAPGDRTLVIEVIRSADW
ncbi:MAG: hypothetical protein ACI8RZ_004686 [Myxococcota bacterium]|jgi:hypothetical protein